MRALALVLSALLVSLPCAGGLPALCGDHHAAAPSCCQPSAACDPGQPATYCCPGETSPAPLATAQAAMPAPLPAPELAAIDLPSPFFAPPLALCHPAPPLSLHPPALYLLHRSYRS
jgi:hypothetical protein